MCKKKQDETGEEKEEGAEWGGESLRKKEEAETKDEVEDMKDCRKRIRKRKEEDMEQNIKIGEEED